MPFARPNLTRPLPRPAVRRPRRPVQLSGGAGASLSQVLGGTNFLVRTWISFDPPNTALPTWIEITAFVETEQTLTINHGRSDGLADANAATLSLTVDNSDGRFCAGNPSGAWYGLIRKGSWLKVDVLPVSGVVSTRFVGFITSLPTGWSGFYATSQITASDRFEKLGNAPALISSIQSEVLSDPNLAGRVKGYWNLHEPQGSLTFGDTSGQGARHLLASALGGTAAGTGFTAANVNAPGVEGLRTATFNPPSTTQGTYLAGTVASPAGSWNLTTGVYTGLYPTVEFWFQATTSGTVQPLVTLVDQGAQSATTVYIDTNGLLKFVINPTVVGATIGGVVGLISTPFGTVADGNWHHVIFTCACTTSGGNLYSSSISIIDGGQATFGVEAIGISGAAVTGTFGSNYTQLIVGGGYIYNGAVVAFQTGAGNVSDVAFYWGDMRSTGGAIPNAAEHYAAGTKGSAGESTDRRTARVARYAGMSVPQQTVANPVWVGSNGWQFTAQTYNPSLAPWVNLSPGAHVVGSQSMGGRTALDVMREAARTEGMPLFVDRSGYLALQPSTIRQNTSPAWTVDSRDLDPGTGLQDDFAYTKNVMTVTPNQQAAQTVIGATGQASQNKYGLYSGSLATASVNPVEAQSLGLGVIQLQADPVPRLAPIVVEAATLASQAGYGPSWYDAVLATEVSTPVRVTSIPAQAGGGNVDAFVEGWTETITAGNHQFSFSTSPIQGPTYQLDDAVLGRLDTDGSTLYAPIGTADTSLQLLTTGGAIGSALWAMDPGDFPFDVGIGGEQVTLTGHVPTPLVGADGTFETGVAGWTTNSTTVTASSADHYQGTACALVALTSTSGYFFTTSYTPTTVGVSYYVFAAFKAVSGTPQVQLYIQWVTSGGFNAGVSNLPVQTAGPTWSTASGVFTCPAGAAKGEPSFYLVGSAGNSVYIDYVLFQPFTSPQTYNATRSVNGVVAAHPSGTAVAVWQPLTLAY